MNREALSMALHLANAVARNEVNAQYHWASLLVLDALASGASGASGANGPEVLTADDILAEASFLAVQSAEDAIDEATR